MEIEGNDAPCCSSLERERERDERQAVCLRRCVGVCVLCSMCILSVVERGVCVYEFIHLFFVFRYME